MLKPTTVLSAISQGPFTLSGLLSTVLMALLSLRFGQEAEDLFPVQRLRQILHLTTPGHAQRPLEGEAALWFTLAGIPIVPVLAAHHLLPLSGDKVFLWVINVFYNR